MRVSGRRYKAEEGGEAESAPLSVYVQVKMILRSGIVLPYDGCAVGSEG